MTESSTDRADLKVFLNRHDYRVALEGVRDTLRNHIIEILGGNWEKIHTDLRMYTINCRSKSCPRTLEKYDKMKEEQKPINPQNFHRFMPDLVGARLVVVDPSDLFNLAEKVRLGCLSPVFEAPGEAFRHSKRVRHGRFSMYDTISFKEMGYHIEPELTGYCSVHFVFRTGENFFSADCPSTNKISLRELHDSGAIPMTEWNVEIQVRTLMDEAWGETDHIVRYADMEVRNDPAVQRQFAALSGYLQAANFHVSLIREMVADYAKKRMETR